MPRIFFEQIAPRLTHGASRIERIAIASLGGYWLHTFAFAIVTTTAISGHRPRAFVHRY
jgi:hypothetical protein